MTKVIKRGYITEKQAAKLLGKNQKWMQNNRYKPKNHGNRLPFIKHAGRILYRKEEVLAYKDHVDNFDPASSIESFRNQLKEDRASESLKPKDTSLRAEWERKGILNSQPKEPFSSSPQHDNELIRIIARRILNIEDKFLRLEDKFAKLEARVKRTEIEKPKGWLANLIG